MTSFTKEQLLALGYAPFSAEEKFVCAIRHGEAFTFFVSESEMIAYIVSAKATGSVYELNAGKFVWACATTEEALCQYSAGVLSLVRANNIGLFDPDR